MENNDNLDKEANLDRWFKEKWVDISKKDKHGKHPPCGRSDTSKGSYPKCRPSRKVSRETPTTSRGMSQKTKEKAVRQKRKAEKAPRVDKKPHMTSHHKLKKKSEVEVLLKKAQWIQIGLNQGWIKKADLHPEDEKLISDISTSEPLLTSMPSDKKVDDAIVVMDHVMSDLEHISNNFFDATEHNDSPERSHLMDKSFQISNEYRNVQLEYGSNPIAFVNSLKEVADKSLQYLDLLINTLSKHNMPISVLIKNLRRDIISARRILERAS